MNLGFIGFGGAAYGLASGLREEGPVDISFFDPLLDSPSAGGVIKQRAAETGARPCNSLAELIEGARIIISCVTGSVAVEVAEKAAPHLGEPHLYVDVNTASPKTMEAVFSAIKGSGALFSDVAMMGGIPAFGHRVPCLASGNGAKAFKALMDPYGMDITCVGDAPGQASAIKMLRSIFMKGFLSLLLEMLHASRTYRVEPIVMDSIAKTMAKNDFPETARLQLTKGVINAKRMSHEMEAVVETLTDLGVPSTMASAARETLQWCSELELAEYFDHEMPASIEDVLDGLAAKTG